MVQSTNAPSSRQIKEEGGSNESGDGVSVSKTIAGTDLENVFDITLQVRTPRTISEVIKEPDMAVVIVTGYLQHDEQLLWRAARATQRQWRRQSKS